MPSGFEDDFPVFDKDRTEGYGVADIIIQRLLSGHIANDQLLGVVDADNRREDVYKRQGIFGADRSEEVRFD